MTITDSFQKHIAPTVSFEPKFHPNYIKIMYNDGVLVMCTTDPQQTVEDLCTRQTDNERAENWTEEMLSQLLFIWRHYHLNDMKPYSVAMKAAGWDVLASKSILQVTFALHDDILKQIDEIKDRLVVAATQNRTVTLTPEEQYLLTLPKTQTNYFYQPFEIITPEYYRIMTERDQTPMIKTTTLGQVHWKTDNKAFGHPDGLLGRPFEPTGEKYGTRFYFHPVPEHVI